MSLTIPATDMSAVGQVTGLLKAWSEGDDVALTHLTPIVYSELHRIARIHMTRERDGNLLQPTALINEAFVRLMGGPAVDWESRTHFFAVFSRLTRRILIDLARAQETGKRGSRCLHVDLAEAEAYPAHGRSRPVSFLDLDTALEALSRYDERQARVVELRYFGGLENREIADLLGISEASVMRDWRLARAWLYSRLAPASPVAP